MLLRDYFERTYVINLPSRADRRREMSRELERMALPLTPKKVELFAAIRPEQAGDWPNVGVLGCFLSHLAVLRQACSDRLANVLVLEDDLATTAQFRMNQHRVIEHLRDQDWDFVYFGHGEKVDGDPVTLRPFFGPLLTAHFYGVNGRILEPLIRYLEELMRRPAGHPEGGPMHVDGAYSWFRRQNPDVVTLIAHPSLGGQRSSRSDLTSAWFDNVPLLRELAGWARQVKVRLQERHAD